MKLGLVAVGKRNIRSGYEYDHLFPKAEMVNRVIFPDGSVKDTVKLMDKIVRETLVDTKQIAKKLNVPGDVYATCKNIFDFVYNNIQYKLDQPGQEQLRRPARAWADRKTGVDCDCYSITISSILTNLGIEHRFRITAYDRDWQHVYVVVPHKGKLIKIDPVLDKFDYEKPFSKFSDYPMTNLKGLGLPIAFLGGLDSDADAIAEAQHNELKGIINGDAFDLNALDGLGDINSLGSVLLDQMYNYIKSTRDYVAANQSSVLTVGGAKAHLAMLNYALANWNTPNRDKALQQLADEEERWNKANGEIKGVDGITNEMELSITDSEFGELGKLKIAGKGKQFFSNVKKSVQAVDKFNKAVVKKVASGAKNVAAKAKEVAKKVGSAIKTFVVKSNPLTLVMRAGFLAAMKVNLFGMAERLLPGLLSQAEAQKLGISPAMWDRSKKGLDKVAGVFEKIGGKRSKLEKYIRTGKAKHKYKGLKGIDGDLGEVGSLGEPVSTAVTVIAAAATLLTAAAKMKEAGINKHEYDKLKQQDLAKQKSVAKSKINGFGEADTLNPSEPSDGTAVPETDQFDTTANGSIDEGKKGLAKFIAAIKTFFNKKKSAANIDTAEIITEEQNETPSTVAEAAASSGADSESSSGSGIMQFVQENPVKVAIGAAFVAGAVGAVVYFNKKGKKSKTALAGARRRRRSKSLSGPGKKSKKKYIKVIRLK
ncbi:MAG: hypothetical protein WAQ28_03460 [Bacteroidia bacterium]